MIKKKKPKMLFKYVAFLIFLLLLEPNKKKKKKVHFNSGSNKTFQTTLCSPALDIFMVFFLLLSLRLKDTDTREDTATVGTHVWRGRGVTRRLLPASSSSSFLHSLVSSSLTSRGGPSMWPSSWAISLAFWWAFSTAAAHARCLEFKHTSWKYWGLWRVRKALDMTYWFTSSESGIPRCGKSLAFPHKHSRPASLVGGCRRAPSSQNQRKQPGPAGILDYVTTQTQQHLWKVPFSSKHSTSASMWNCSPSLCRNLLTEVSLSATPCCLIKPKKWKGWHSLSHACNQL